MTKTRTSTKPSTTSQGRARSALALVLAGTLLAGCASNSDAASPDDPGAATHSTDSGEGTTTDDQEPQPAPDNPALDEAVKDWQPLSEYDIVLYDKATKNFTSAQMRAMSHNINRFAWGMSVRKRSLQAKDTKSLEADIIRWLPSSAREITEEAFTRTEQGVYPSEIRVFTNRLPYGSVLRDNSVYTQAWNAEEFTHDDGTPGVKLTLFWRILYRYEDPDGITRALPVARWITLGTSNIPEARQHSEYNLELGVSTPYDNCTLHVDGALTTGQELKDVNVEDDKTLTTPHDAFIAFEDWGNRETTPLSKGELKEVASACQPTTT